MLPVAARPKTEAVRPVTKAICELTPRRSGLRSLVAVQPFRRAPADIARGVISPGGDEKLLADVEPMYLTVHFKFFLAFDQHHQFIGFMDEVLPHSAWRIGPQVAGKATRVPIFLNSFLIDGCHEQYSRH